MPNSAIPDNPWQSEKSASHRSLVDRIARNDDRSAAVISFRYRFLP
jgi:hypothetical protein